MRVLFYLVLIVCFCLGAYFKQFGIFYKQPWLVSGLVAISFAGAIGLLLDYASRIKKSLWALVPFLLAVEVMGDLLYNAQLRDFSYYVYFGGMMLYPIYGLLFIRKGVQLLNGQSKSLIPGFERADKFLALKFLLLGILAISMLTWEYATYHSRTINTSGMLFKGIYMGVFLWLLVIDFSTQRLDERGFKIEREILNNSLLVIAIMYFVRFVFK